MFALSTKWWIRWKYLGYCLRHPLSVKLWFTGYKGCMALGEFAVRQGRKPTKAEMDVLTRGD